jgi:hypothetical protein
VDQGLPHAIVNDFLETSKGELWIATNVGPFFQSPPLLQEHPFIHEKTDFGGSYVGRTTPHSFPDSNATEDPIAKRLSIDRIAIQDAEEPDPGPPCPRM